MDGPLYPRVFAAHGIAAEIPAADDRRVVNEIIGCPGNGLVALPAPAGGAAAFGTAVAAGVTLADGRRAGL
jgi:hypothetical protein